MNKDIEANNVQRLLMTVFLGYIALAVVIFLLFETGIIAEGPLAHDTRLSFAVATALELATICDIPLALYLFHRKQTKATLREKKWSALRGLGILRIALLGNMLILNALCYYLFLGVMFGYLAIIVLISMYFVVPTMNRCRMDIGEFDVE